MSSLIERLRAGVPVRVERWPGNDGEDRIHEIGAATATMLEAADAMHFNGLTPAEAERLAILIEECGEVIQAAGKVLRHGYESFNPLDDEPVTNRDDLARELGHVYAIASLMEGAPYKADLSSGRVQGSRLNKLRTLPKWTHHQPDSELKP